MHTSAPLCCVYENIYSIQYKQLQSVCVQHRVVLVSSESLTSDIIDDWVVSSILTANLVSDETRLVFQTRGGTMSGKW